MAGLAQVLTNLAANQLTGSVTVGSDTYAVAQVYTGKTPGNHAPGHIWVQNTWQFTQQDDFIAQEVHRYDISMQWFVGEVIAEGTNLALAANLMWENWLNIWIADQGLAAQTGTKSVISSIMTGGDALLEFNAKQYYGIDAVLSCQVERDSNA
jgi:hypothetical protein|tara:strand:- start:13271 stop:13729 length:459 start_codon:yes stop_codon:yes gene_type:complete